VFQTLVGVAAQADNGTVLDNHRTYTRIRRGQADTLARKVEGAPEKLLVRFMT